MSTDASQTPASEMPWDKHKRAMVVVAHPDDAEFGFAGTLARMTREGMELAYVLCTNGDKGTSDPDMTSERLASIRQEEQRNASAILGSTDVTFLGYGDGELESTREVIGRIVREIRRFRPDVIFCQDPYSRNRHNHRDHRMAGQSTFDAVYPFARDRLHFPEHEAEGFQPHKVLEIYTSTPTDPDLVVDISDVIDVRIEALKAHRSQIGNPEELEERIRGRVSKLAEQHGLKYAEGFRLHTFNPGRPLPAERAVSQG